MTHRWINNYLSLYGFGFTVASCALICVVARLHSPNLDEVGHLPAGYAFVELGNIELYEVNPPLAKALAALPLVSADAKADWSRFSDAPGARCEWTVGSDFIAINGTRSFWLFAMARWALLPIWMIGTLVIGWWASELGGAMMGFAAVVVWSLCPEVIGWTATICPDSAAASLGVMTL